MSTVFRAYDPRFERDVALKVLPQEFLHDPSFRARFEREAKTIAALEHPAIVPVYDFGEEAAQPYLVMRYMSGGSLADRLKQGALPVTEAVGILRRIGSALNQAHSQGIIHRDLKPGNILFDQYGDSYLGDFGIVKLTQQTATFTGSAIIGTPAYMSPEQAKGEAHLDGRSDIYALGAILFEILTGKQPYEADTPMGVAIKHIVEPVPRILEVKPDLPPGCAAVIERAMAKDREERYPQATELVETLHQTVTAAPIPPSPPSIPSPDTGRRQQAPTPVVDRSSAPEPKETLSESATVLSKLELGQFPSTLSGQRRWLSILLMAGGWGRV